jgi:hypothetical protein
MSNVTVLPGCAVPVPEGEAIPSIIELLEGLLAEAKSGTLTGVAVATVRREAGGRSRAGNMWEDASGERGELITAVNWLAFRMMRRLDDADGGE